MSRSGESLLTSSTRTRTANDQTSLLQTDPQGVGARGVSGEEGAALRGPSGCVVHDAPVRR